MYHTEAIPLTTAIRLTVRRSRIDGPRSACLASVGVSIIIPCFFVTMAKPSRSSLTSLGHQAGWYLIVPLFLGGARRRTTDCLRHACSLDSARAGSSQGANEKIGGDCVSELGPGGALTQADAHYDLRSSAKPSHASGSATLQRRAIGKNAAPPNLP
jgi:hypothetical protein